MAERVGIVAVAQTKYAEARRDVRQYELGYSVVKQVMDETGLKWEEGTGIDHAVSVSDDFWDARTISDVPYGDILGAHGRDVIKVAQDGAQAVLYSMATIQSMHDDITLILGICKESQPLSRNILTSCGIDPVYTRILGIDYLGAAALQAQRYMYKYGITREQCAKVVVKNRGNAFNNPFAQEPMDITVEDVLKSRMLASPISLLDYYPVSDGACCIIYACEEKAKKITDKPVWIKDHVTIHREDCYNIVNEKEKERLVPVEWGQSDLLYPVNIQIEAWDRVGLVSDITTVVAEEKVNIARVSLNNIDNQRMIVDLTLETKGLAHLSHVMKKLDAVKGIVGVTRIGDETSRKTGVDTSVYNNREKT